MIRYVIQFSILATIPDWQINYNCTERKSLPCFTTSPVKSPNWRAADKSKGIPKMFTSATRNELLVLFSE
jgi:hypothetical protein